MKALSAATQLVFLALICLAITFVGVSAGAGTKEQLPGGQPQSIDAAVEDGKVDVVTAERVLEGDMATALVTVSYADTVAPVPGADVTEAIAADSRSYAARKEAALSEAGAGVTRLRDYRLLPVMLVRIDGPVGLRELASAPQVVSVQPNRRNRTDLAQSLPLIRQPQAQAAGQTGAGTAVAVLDTGVDFHRAAFGSCAQAGAPGCKVAYAHDFAPDDGSVDDSGHGTNVAGISLGVAPSTRILALDVFTSGTGAYDSDILAAIQWAIDNRSTYGIRAMNLSLGMEDRHTVECVGSSYSGPFQLARSVGILPVVAAGNFAYVNGSYADGVSAPACAPGAMRVGAVYDSSMGSRGWGGSPYGCSDSTTAADRITCFSQSGRLLSLLAPGSEITAAGITQSGTSQATPHVAGAAAVLGAVRPQASAAKIDRALRSSGPVIFDPRSGVSRHRLDLPDAIANLQSSSALLESGGCAQNVLGANDDGSTAAVALPFMLNLFGSQYTEAFVNNNGNITFEQPMRTYTPFSITATVPPMIAPFFGDVDTRSPWSRLVTYGATSFGGRPAFCVNWVDVGYYSARAEKTNSFQLLLVDRSNLGAGDFDVIMNYDEISWETGEASGGTDGRGGTAAAAGYSAGDGDVEHFFAFPGSLTPGALLDDDPDGLIHRSRGSQQPGRYIFPIRNGLAPGNSILAGSVTGPGGGPLGQAPVQACAAGGQCVTTRTTSSGEYLLAALAPGDYEVRALPPRGSSLTPSDTVPAQLFDGATTTVDFALAGPAAPPPGTTITDRGRTGDGIPVLYWTDSLTLTTTACPGGSASYAMTVNGQVVRSGAMSESPLGSGRYTAAIAPLYPLSGSAVTVIDSACPDPGDNDQVRFDVYIDPSGTVVDTQGRPLPGARVTLLRSDIADGPFEVVADGGPEMSPANRANPDFTRADGGFGWDVLAGFYRVRAELAGCTSPADPGISYAETGALAIPPPVTNLVLVLSCPGAPGGGGGGGGGGVAGGNAQGETTTPPAAETEKPRPKALNCRRGFRKKTVKGKRKCVKAKKRKHRGAKSR